MNVQLLVDSIVRQTTVLIAQLATAGGARAPLAHVANQVFADLVQELDSQGISRRVAADMFGLALRTYQRKIQRLGESGTDRGRSLWEAVFDYLNQCKIATRGEIFARFPGDDDQLVRGVLHDLTESGLAFVSGTGEGAVYRAVTDADLSHVRGLRTADAASVDTMVWAIVYREGPISRDEIVARMAIGEAVADAAIPRLLEAGRIEEDAGKYRSRELFIPYGSSIGWEAAVFDHFQAVVRTIVNKLRADQPPAMSDKVGGSTYTFVVWDQHPLNDEVLARLARFRAESDALRAKVDEYNARTGIPARHRKVVAYGGQHVIEEDEEE